MYTLNYYPWLTQNIAPDVIRAQITIFAQEIASQLKALGAAVTAVAVAPPIEVGEQIQQIVGGQAQIALMNPLGFVFARRRSGAVDAVAVAQRIIDGQVGVVYFSQLYCRADMGIATLAEAKGSSVGYGTPISTSNFLIPAHLLKASGIHPLLDFRRVEFLQGHEIVARAVYFGKVAIGAGHDGVIVDLAAQPGFEDAKDKLRQIGRSPPIPSDPVVVNIADAGEKALLQKAIVAAGNTAAGKAALKIFWGNTQGLEATTAAPYQVLLDAMTDLRFEEADLLPAS
jgi:ABC-type phosphate/phosphonate transport system substrate-binding protein